ncbi:hypothetical protein HXX76_003651 [Chlamydomonas incerta]|uniref:Uncharacterized protein n=1 Tax=Chlamydomonas incerta TaxID=51695 RepID=A0A835TLE2_CHLIN|nr:hypothetical protein HXX76_003651 [Chlamydomonas incerta]|eukprot:KAG2440796.1 hypothetical protein HXX76_003651 [Chlamydomonas incerta]
MELQRTLDGHGGCVNTVSFNPAGDLLVSGSDDQAVMLWDWRRGVRRLRYEPGHTNNIFQARFLPGTHDKTLVSCAADGQVRVTYFREGAGRPTTKRLHRHSGRAHKIALQHASPYDAAAFGSGSATATAGSGGGPPCFYSSGEDGDICFFDLRVTDSEALGVMAATAGTGEAGSDARGRRRFSRSRTVIDINAIHVNPARPWQLVVGGSDECVQLYDVRVLTSLTSSYVSAASPGAARRAAASESAAASGGGGGRGGGGAPRCRVHGSPLMELCPAHLRPPAAGESAAAFRRPTHVTCVAFGQNGDVLATYNDDDVYLFRPPGTQGSGGGEGRPGTSGRRQEDERSEEESSEEEDEDEQGGGGGGKGKGKGWRWWRQQQEEEDEEDEDDSLLRPSRRRRRPGSGGGKGGKGGKGKEKEEKGKGDGGAKSQKRAGSDDEEPQDYVIKRYSGHRNNRTVKGVSFLGEREEWVVSGSDCGHVYIWDRHSGRLHAWLRGDSYVVNCLEPHPTLPLHLATSGIDDDIKLWAPTAEQPRLPGPAAEAAMRDNAAARSGAGRAGGGARRLVLPPAMVRALLSNMAEEEEAGGAGERAAQLRAMLMTALTGMGGLSDDDEDEDDEDDDDDGGDTSDEEDEEDAGGEGEEDGEEEEGGHPATYEDEDEDEEEGNEGEEAEGDEAAAAGPQPRGGAVAPMSSDGEDEDT